MRFLIDIALAVVIATIVGFSTAWYAVENGGRFGEVMTGPWTARPDAGGLGADPYSVAFLARTGEVPLGSGEGVTFAADVDDNGKPLSGRCSYMLSGQVPAARLWTLTAYDAGGHLMANPARRTGLHSREVIRRPDGAVDVTISAKVASGNWLPIAPVDNLRLVFRLYDTPVTAASRNADVVMPAISRGVCE